MSTAVEWIACTKMNIDFILHLLDKFLIIAPSYESCSQQQDLFLRLCSYLGIPMALQKIVGPSTTLSFAGIALDSISMVARLPHVKIQKCTTLISQFLRRKKVTLTELQSLIGLLNFACAVVKPGRAFLRRLSNLTIGICSAHHLICLTSEAKADLRLWLSFLSQFNCQSFFLNDKWLNSRKLNLFTDASGALGFGAIFGNHWYYGRWPNEWDFRILSHCLKSVPVGS